MGAGKTRPARLCSAAAVVSDDKRVDEKHGIGGSELEGDDNNIYDWRGLFSD